MTPPTLRNVGSALADKARGEDLGLGRERGVCSEARGAVRRTAEPEQEIALGLLAFQVRDHARRVRTRSDGRQYPDELPERKSLHQHRD